MWAVQGGEFRSLRVPNSPRLRLIGRLWEFASSITYVPFMEEQFVGNIPQGMENLAEEVARYAAGR